MYPDSLTSILSPIVQPGSVDSVPELGNGPDHLIVMWRWPHGKRMVGFQLLWELSCLLILMLSFQPCVSAEWGY